MDVDLIFKIAAIGILVAVLNQLLIRSGREEQAMMTTLAGAHRGVDDAYHADQHAVRYDQIGVWAMSTVLTVSAAAVFAAVCGALLKRGQKEIALLFSLAAAVLVFLCVLPQIETLTSTFREWAELSGMPEVFGALLKALGIVLIGRITADLCKDAGESAIASGVELAVKTAVLLTALPLLNRLLSLLQEVLLL